MAVNGDRAWTDSTFYPFLELTGRHLEHIKLDHPLLMVGDWRALFDEVALMRADELDGERVYVVKLKKGEAPPRTVYVGAESGHVLKRDTVEIARGIGEVPLTVRFHDHREVDGLRLPFRIVAENEFNGRVEIRLDTVETNVKLPEDAFVLKAKLHSSQR